MEEASKVIAATLRLIADGGGVAESELLSLQSRNSTRVDSVSKGTIALGAKVPRDRPVVW